MLTYVQKQFTSSSRFLIIPPPLCAFANQLQTATVRFFMSVRLSAANSAVPVGYIFGKFSFHVFYENSSTYDNCGYNRTKIAENCMKPIDICDYISQ